MHTYNGTLYPMLGVGAFMVMFWTGFVIGHELGLGCVSMLMTGLLCASVATVAVCELKRRDAHGLVAGASAQAPSCLESPVSRARAPAADAARPRRAVATGASLPLESC